MKKWTRFLVGIVVLCIIYFVFLIFVDRKASTGSAPTFEVPTSVLTASVEDDESDLIKGLKATDREDGDLSSKIFIENMSSFDDNNCRTVTFGVFDSDDNLTRATRTIKYTDYQKPTITLTKALCYYYYVSNDEFKDFVSAESVVDGDLTSQIAIDKDYYEGDDRYIVYSVTDSCGTKTTLTVKATELKQAPNVDITLTDYLIRVPVGTLINPSKYIDSVSGVGSTQRALRQQIEITNNYNPDVPGTYEYVYRIAKSNGDYGVTKLVVIVE